MKLKSLLTLLLRVTLTLTGLILLYLLSAFCLSRITVAEEPDSTEDITIYIRTNGVHTDIVVPVKSSHLDWSKHVKYSNTISKDSTMQWLSLGWGDRGFYLETPTWSDLKAKVAIKAAFGLGRSAMHATFYRIMFESESCKKIMISHEQYQRLIKYLLESFQKDENDDVKHIATRANYSDVDAFYEAEGRYSLFFTCNTWANSALKSAGQKSCLWTPFDTGIFLKYR